MPSAYKLPNASHVITAIEEAQAVLTDINDKANALAASIGEGVSAQIRRSGFSNHASGTSLTVDRADRVLADGWRYVKTRDQVEPARGAKGEDASAELAAVQPPEVQPASIVASTGLPAFSMTPGFSVTRSAWMAHEGELYALVADGDHSDKLSDDWQPIKMSELHAADEARLEKAEPSVQSA